jgi:hypothetical protein
VKLAVRAWRSLDLFVQLAFEWILRRLGCD